MKRRFLLSIEVNDDMGKTNSENLDVLDILLCQVARDIRKSRRGSGQVLLGSNSVGVYELKDIGPKSSK
jgi:hypothetical protein